MKNREPLPQKDILKIINEIKFFNVFTEYEKKRLAGVGGCIAKYNPGVKIIKEGESDATFYVLHSGVVAVHKRGVHLNNLAEGEIFGEMAFLVNTIRSTSVTAQEKVTVFCLDQDSMARLNCEIREKIKDHCIRKLVNRLNKMTERFRMRV
ncbi:MAG: cyclic nucleotide-binding domain-containing protein [Magnetococcales bacterium]|nr:cyclic nucleotide-binding domain-containing protein [Magnetococcales bacterium]